MPDWNTLGSALSWPWLGQTLWWSGLTIAAYWLALRLFARTGHHPLAIPVLTAGALLTLVLLASGTPYREYEQGVSFLKWLLAPALVLLAVPMRQQLQRLRAVWLPLSVAVLAGSVTALGSTVAIGLALGVDTATLVSMMPKSATMPIAIKGAEAVGGLAGIVAVNVVITGVVGAMLVPPMLRWMRLDGDIPRGVTSGLVAHAIGTAREMQASPLAGTFAALAMSLTGLCTAVLLPLAAWLLRCLT